MRNIPSKSLKKSTQPGSLSLSRRLKLCAACGLLAGLLAFPLTGCNDTVVAAVSGEQAEQIREINKWNCYVELSNDLNDYLHQPIDSYFAAFGREPEYRISAEHHDVVTFISALVSPEQLSENIKRAMANAENPQDELDEAVAQMAIHLDELWNGLAESRDYHAAQLYVDDDYKRARQLHARIQKADTDFNSSYQNFRHLLHQKDSERRKKDLETMISQNLVLKPAMLRVVDSAQAMQNLLNGHSITSETLPSLNVEAFSSFYGEFSESAEALKKLQLNDQAKVIAEGLKADGLENFVSDIDKVLKSGALLIDRCRDKTKVAAQMLNEPGTPETFSQDVGTLVDSYNFTVN